MGVDVEVVLESGLKVEKVVEKTVKCFISGEIVDVPLSEIDRVAEACRNKRILRCLAGRSALLTEDQNRVFDKLLGGGLHKEIAFELETTEKNIKFHSQNICRLFGVGRKIELLALALRK